MVTDSARRSASPSTSALASASITNRTPPPHDPTAATRVAPESSCPLKRRGAPSTSGWRRGSTPMPRPKKPNAAPSVSQQQDRRHECRGSRRGVVSSPLRGLASDDLLVPRIQLEARASPLGPSSTRDQRLSIGSGHLESRQCQPAQRASPAAPASFTSFETPSSCRRFQVSRLPFGRAQVSSYQ